MSRASKIAIVVASCTSTAVIGGVYLMKHNEVEYRKAGIAKDDERRARKRLENTIEHERQEALRLELEATQKVSSRAPQAT